MIVNPQRTIAWINTNNTCRMTTGLHTDLSLAVLAINSHVIWLYHCFTGLVNHSVFKLHRMILLIQTKHQWYLRRSHSGRGIRWVGLYQICLIVSIMMFIVTFEFGCIISFLWRFFKEFKNVILVCLHCLV